MLDMSAFHVARLHHRHAGIRPRNRFLPPVFPVYRCDAPDDRVPPLPLLVDPFGEEVPDRDTTIRIAHCGDAFLVRADVVEDRPIVRPGLSPGHPDFWRQDHIEFRILPNPGRDLDQVQVVLSAGGDVLVAGEGSDAGAVTCEGGPVPGGWSVTARIPHSAAGLSPLAEGNTFLGLVAHTRWGDGYLDVAGCTPAQLGFSHAERFARFTLAASPPDVTMTGVYLQAGPLDRGRNRAIVALRNGAESELRGRFRLTRESGATDAGKTAVSPCALRPGETALEVALELERPLYNRFSFVFEQEYGVSHPLAAVTLRAGVPRQHGIDATKLRHPYLLLDARDIESLRAKSRLPAFKGIVESFTPGNRDFDGNLPDDVGDVSLDVQKGDGNWLRVCRESLLRGGEGGTNAAHARIWSLLPPAARDAVREIDRKAGDDEAEQQLVNAFNSVLARPDFYDSDAFAAVSLPDETRTILEVARDGLDERGLFLHNRVVFQCAVECVREFRIDLAAKAGEFLDEWTLSGDARLIRKATRYLEAADRCMITAPHIDLHTGGIGSHLAWAYDAFHPHLSEQERSVWQRVLRRLLRLHLATARQRHWNCTAIPNANPVCNAGGGLLALALLNEFPEEAAESLYFARKFIWNWLDYCGGTEGGNTEGAQYWQYGTESFLPFPMALERVLGHDDGLLSHPLIVNAMNMVRVGLCNDGSLHGVNDTVPLPVGGPVAWFCASRYGDRLGLWYGDHTERVYRKRLVDGKPAPYRTPGLWGLLVRPDEPECVEQPPLPTAMVLEDIQYGILRSGANHDCALVAGLKGSQAPYTHHNQPDTGSFFIHLRGERLLIDPGYYKEAPEFHNLPTIAGTSPETPSGTVGRLVCAERGDMRWLACDATAAYRGTARRVVRHLVMIGEQGIVLLDDIVAAGGAKGHVLTRYQCGGRTEDIGAGRRLLVAGEQRQLRIELLTRPKLHLELHEERTLHDTHWGYKFADCRHFPVSGTYVADEADPLVTVFLDAGASDEEAALERTEGRLRVTLPRGGSARFVQLTDGWVPDLG